MTIVSGLGQVADMTFDFEVDVQAKLPSLADSHNPNFVRTSTVLGLTQTRVDPKHRSKVCIHWLSGLCQKGDACGYLHKMDKSKMPDCRHGSRCKIKNCPLVHVDEEARPECMFFKQGFCFHGPNCKFRHVKLSPDDCPATAQFNTMAVDQEGEGGAAAPSSKGRKTQTPNLYYKITLCKHWLKNGMCPFGDDCHFAHSEAELKSFSGTEDLDDTDIFDPIRNEIAVELTRPWDEDHNVSYFFVHSPDLRSLVVSRRRQVWMLPLSVATEVTAASQKSEKVILFFGVKSLGGIYGIAEVAGPIPPLNPMMPISPEFPVRWLHTTRISLKMVSQLKMSDGSSIARISHDGLLGQPVGYEILLVLLRKVSWDWSRELEAAESGKFDQERSMSAALPADALFGQTWFQRANDMAMNMASNNSGSGGGDEYFYNGEKPGFVMACRGAILQEVFSRFLFGVPNHLRQSVMDNIVEGTPLFVINTDDNTIAGLYEAVDKPDTYDADAFRACMPTQVPFRIVIDGTPTGIQDVDVKGAMGGHPAVGPMNLLSTKRLATVFAVMSGVMKRGRMSSATHITERNYTSGYKAPFEFVGSVLVGIDLVKNAHLAIGVRKSLLGASASNILGVLNAFASPRTAKARLRGLGSGYGEGPDKRELQEPLQFTVSTQNEEELAPVMRGIEALCARVRAEFQF